jgi:hypothetical protein
MKIQTTVKVYDVVEMDISFPYYCKTDDSFLMLVSETKALRITCQGCKSIMTTSPTASHTKQEIASAVVCSGKEFFDAYTNAFNAIWNIVVTRPEQVETPVVDLEEDPNIYHETITEERLFDEPFANELYEREEGLS